MAIKQDLTYEIASTGKHLTLKPIPPLLLQRFLLEWKKKYPRPSPPPREMKVGDEIIAVPNSADPYFQVLLQDWEEEQGSAQVDFFLYYGILDNPPDDWTPDEVFYLEGQLTRIKRKAIWLSEFLESVDDITDITEAIQSLNMVTDKGLETSKNGSTQPQVDLTSLVES